jgi:hypothetical protein
MVDWKIGDWKVGRLEKIRVLIADDHSLVRAGIRSLLGSH